MVLLFFVRKWRTHCVSVHRIWESIANVATKNASLDLVVSNIAGLGVLLLKFKHQPDKCNTDILNILHRKPKLRGFDARAVCGWD